MANVLTLEEIEGGSADKAARRISRVRIALPSRLTTIGLPLAYFMAALLAAEISARTSTIVWPLWPPSAILLVVLVRSRVATWPILFLLGVGADVAAMLLVGSTLLEQVGIGVANSLESVLVALMLRRWASIDKWYLSVRSIALFPLFCILASAVAAAVGTGWSTMVSGVPFLLLFKLWTVTDALSLIIITPFLLCWTEPSLRRRLTAWQLTELVVLTLCVGGVTYYTFANGMAFLFLIFPFLALITLRGGLLGATAGAVILTAVSLWFGARGVGPFEENLGLGEVGKVLVLQLFFLAAALSTIPIALILNLREMTAEQLRQQDSISNAALNNMVQGLCMFDAEHRLITCNQRYADLYQLPDTLMAPGTPLERILEEQVRAGNYWGKPEDYIKNCLDEADIMSPHSEVELPDGRIIDIHRQRLANHAWVATHEDVTDRRRAGQRIAYLASHDPLTGLPNRAFFREELQRSLALAGRGHNFALHSLDLDRFKAVNDTLGHAAGDELLRQVGDRLRRSTRENDFVARLGGDEFAIVQFPVQGAEEASSLAARVVEALGKPYQINGHEVLIGASIGVALAPSDTLDMADLLQKSDLALYRAKTNGRNTFCFFEAGMDTLLQARRVLETELRSAIQKGEFELYYQPILSVESGAISAFEALIRWQHPIRGIVEPLEFVPIAEESGLIVPIGEWVLRQACREAAGWPPEVKVTVNLSPAQFKSKNLVALVKSALTAAKIAPERLELEITEALLLKDTDSILSALEGLHKLGVTIAMDDFGTGYSSLSYIRSFPFDRIKIDRSFVNDLTTQEDSLAIVHATTEISARLGMRTTAEGVETAEQLNILREEGCTEIQGYYISRPLPAQQVMEMLGRYPPNPVSLPKVTKIKADRRS